MIDLPLGNQKFTWSNMQSCPTLAKLDRFLISTEWNQAFPLSKVVAMPKITSDHSPILLSTSDRLVTRSFRFEKVWLSRDDFCSAIPCWWTEVPNKGSSVLNIVAKLRHCRKRIKEWCSESFYSISRTKTTIPKEILQMDTLEEHQTLSPAQHELRKSLKSRLQQVIADEEILLKSRAKQHWLQEGDGNTKFFHASANGRRRENNIFAVEDAGHTIYGEEAKRDYFFNKFKEAFAPDNADSGQTGDWSSLFCNKSIPNPERLTVPFTLDEIKKATFQLGGDKAPGPDGFNLKFF